MSETNNQGNKAGAGNFFSAQYRNRIKVTKGGVTIVNLSLLFAIIALLCAPWLVIGGALVALVLGYKFSFSRNDSSFGESWDNIVHRASDNVKNVVNSIGTDQAPQINHPEDEQNGQNQQ